MKDQIHIQYFNSPFGELILGSFDNKLCLADWRYRKMRTTVDSRIKKGLNADYNEGSSEIINQTITQLNEYFEGKRKEFNIPLLFIGTDFQKRVWNELIKIPFGRTSNAPL